MSFNSPSTSCPLEDRRMRTTSLRALMRTIAIAGLAEREQLPTGAAIERAAAATASRHSRRAALKGLAAGAAAAALPRWAGAQSNTRVAIVGAGLAGLAC